MSEVRISRVGDLRRIFDQICLDGIGEICSNIPTVFQSLISLRVCKCNQSNNENRPSVGERNWGWRGGCCGGHVRDEPIDARELEKSMECIGRRHIIAPSPCSWVSLKSEIEICVNAGQRWFESLHVFLNLSTSMKIEVQYRVSESCIIKASEHWVSRRQRRPRNPRGQSDPLQKFPFKFHQI